MASKSLEPENLKSLLIRHLKGEKVKTKKITLEGHLGAQLQLSDSKSYFFLSKNLKKECAKVNSKSVTITLVNWNFVSVSKARKGKPPSIDIEAQKVQVTPSKSEFELSKTAKNVFDYKDVQKAAETEAPTKDSAREKKVKTSDRAKDALKASKTRVQETKKDSVKKKIAKMSKTSKKSEIVKASRKVQFTKEAMSTPKSKATVLKLKSTPFDVPKHSAPESNRTPVTSDTPKFINDTKDSDEFISFNILISPEELIEAPEFLPIKRKASVTKTMKLSPAKKTQKVNIHESKKEFLSQKQRYLLSSITSEIAKSSLLVQKDDVNASLQNEGISIKDILMGVHKGKISWEEITFPLQVLEHISFGGRQ
jgi:hypothetical protein